MPATKITLPKIRRPDKLPVVSSPAHRRFSSLAARLLLAGALFCGLLSPVPVAAVLLTTPEKIASWGTGVLASGRLSDEPPGDQDCIRVGEPCAYEIASGLPEWLSRDPIGEDGGINLYAYVGNGPIGLIDPLGLVAPPGFRGMTPNNQQPWNNFDSAALVALAASPGAGLFGPELAAAAAGQVCKAGLNATNAALTTGPAAAGVASKYDPSRSGLLGNFWATFKQWMGW